MPSIVELGYSWYYNK